MKKWIRSIPFNYFDKSLKISKNLTGNLAWNNVSKEYLSRGIFVKRLAVIGLAIALLTSNINTRPAEASCYGYNGSRQERIKLQDKTNGYIKVWATKSLKGQMVGRLRHGEVIKTLKYVEGPYCGGSIYIRFKNSQGRIAYGWVFSDALVYSIE
jgi:hypothetical protein